MPCGCYSLSFSRASTGSTFQRDVHPGEPLEFSRTKPLEFSRTKLAYIYIYKEEGRMRHEQNKASRASIYIYIYKEEGRMRHEYQLIYISTYRQSSIYLIGKKNTVKTRIWIS
jgi:hypothetical protein